ncbi:MAG TPA: Mur ligase family protein, partial [Hyphomicrobiaceae bacterium]|nr:Mur ligase family protein [Hyphomicrobiaceae bacterium]
MNLDKLVGPETAAPSGYDQVSIAGLTADSREVRPGWLFAALRGSKADGSRFVAEAVAKGVAAVLTEAGTQVEVPARVPLLVSAEPRRALALMAARFYGTQPETAVAVTGTSGKTSVADFTRQIFAALGHGAASLGTIGLITSGERRYGSLTSPDPVTLHRTLAELAQDGITHLALEASSHGLDQHRLDGLRLKAAAFTNLGHDHLDYHRTVPAYFDAKLRILRLLARGAWVVINADDRRAEPVAFAARAAGAWPVM